MYVCMYVCMYTYLSLCVCVCLPGFIGLCAGFIGLHAGWREDETRVSAQITPIKVLINLLTKSHDPGAPKP